MPDHDTKVSQEQNVPQDANRQQGTGIKNTANGITAAKYYTARMADYTRRFAEVDFSDPDAVIPSEPSDAEIQIRYMEMSDDELTAEYEKLLQDNTYLWEYSTAMDETAKGGASLPKWVRNTGDTALLTQYMEENKDTLTYEQKYLIRHRMEATEKKHQIQQEVAGKTAEGAELYPVPEVKTEPRPDGDEMIELTNVRQKAKQSSGAGCWSVFLANLAGSRGVDLSQEEIRSYRPEQEQQDSENTRDATDNVYNWDTINNALERGDSILAYMPGQMLSELEITRYSEEQRKNGISRAEFEQNAVAQLKTTIKHALKEDRSPVGLLAGGHYLTITGIDGDIIKFKDSAGRNPDPDHTYTGSLASIASDILGNPGVFGIQLTWMKEVRLSKDGRTIFGVPSEYVRMKPDGTVQGQPGPILAGAGLPEEGLDIHKEGIAVGRYAGTEDTKPQQNYRPVLTNGIIKSEKFYLPKKLDAGYLKNKAEARTNEEERRLRQTDNAYFSLNRPLEPVMEDPGVPDYEPKMHAAEQRFEAELGDSWKSAIENGAEFIRNGADVELEDIAFITVSDPDVSMVSAEDRQRAKNACEDIFGTDLRGTPVLDSDNTLHRFTYKKTPDGEPVNVWEDVESQLKKNPLYVDINNETIRSFVRPLILRAMMDKDSGLTFENGERSVRNISGIPEADMFPREKEEDAAEANAFFPDAYGEDLNQYAEDWNPFARGPLSYSDAQEEAVPEQPAPEQPAPEQPAPEEPARDTVKASETGKADHDAAGSRNEENRNDEKKPAAETEAAMEMDPDALLKALGEDRKDVISGQNKESFPEEEASNDLPKAYSDEVVEAQENPFAGTGAFDLAAGPYDKNAEAIQPNPFEGIPGEDYAGGMYRTAVDRNAMLFKDPETEESYAVQRNTGEKLWFTAFYLAKGHALKDAGRSYTDAEEQKKSEILTNAVYDVKSLQEAFRALVQIETKTAVAIGEEAADVQKRLHINGDPRAAADYLTKDGSSKAIQMGRGTFELEFLLRERLEELKEADPDTFAKVDFDKELEDARGRYLANRLKAADRTAYERGKQIYDAETIERPFGVMRPMKHGRDLVEFDRVLHAKKPVFVAVGDKIQDIIDKGTGAEMPTDFANNYYKELDCLRGLAPAAEKIRKTLGSARNLPGYSRYVLEDMNDLVRDLSRYYHRDQNGRYTTMDSYVLYSLRNKYTKLVGELTGLRNDYASYRNQRYIDAHRSKRVSAKDLKPFNDALKLLSEDLRVVDRAFQARQTTTLPLAAFKYSRELEQINYVNGVFKRPGFVEYSRIHMGSGMTPEAIRQRFAARSPEQILEEYRKALQIEPRFSEFLPSENKIPARIENTSDVKQIEDYMKRNDLLLTEQEKAHLVNHIMSANRAENIRTIAENDFDRQKDYYDNGKRKPSVVVSGEDAAELEIHQDEWTTSANGSWSVAAAMMVNSLGGQRLVKQLDIRNYRPKLAEGEMLDKDGMMDSIYSRDTTRNLMDMGDSILAYAPNKMIRQLDIQPYDREIEKNGISPDEYLSNAEKLFKKQVLHVIKTDKCPMPFKMGDHYITITGIDGDTIKYKECSEAAAKAKGAGFDHTFTVSVHDLIGQQLTGAEKDRGSVQLTWISDIRLNKDGKSIFGVPSKYAEVMEDGSVLPAPRDISDIAEQENTVANRNGIRFYRLGGDEENNKATSKDRDLYTDGGIIKLEKAYLPNRLPMKYLVKEAESRSPEEEQRLNENDITMLGIDRNRTYDRYLAGEAAENRADGPDEILEFPGIEPTDRGNGAPAPDHKDGKGAPDHGYGEDAPGRSGDGGQPSEEFTADQQLAMLQEIHRTAEDLEKRLGQSTPWYINRFTDGFYITDTSTDFDDLQEQVKTLKELTGNAGKNGAKITEKDLQDIQQTLKATIEYSRDYLEHKSKQFMKDSSRKDRKSKSGTEQARIRAAVESYEKLSALRIDLNAAVHKQSRAYADMEREKVSGNVKDYNDLLVSNPGRDMQRMQDESFRNKTDIPERHMRRLVRLEAVFGKKPEFLEEFQDKQVMKLIEVEKNGKKEKVSSFTQLTEIKEEFKGIGPAGKNSKLSDKDFVAIAIAETTTNEVFRPEYEKLKKHKAFEGMTLKEVAENYSAHTFDAYSAEIMDKLTGTIPFVQAARLKAAEDLKAYERGDKRPLATVLANNLNFLSKKWKANNHALFDSGTEFLFTSEVGQRMYGILERDPELMDLAKKAGLNPEIQFNLKAMAREGRARLQGSDMMHGAIGASDNVKDITKDKGWEDQDVKLDRFADMLLVNALNVEGYKAEAKKDAIKEIKELSDKVDREYREKLMTAQCRKALAVIRTYKDRAEFKTIYDRFRKDCEENGVNENELNEGHDKFLNILYGYSVKVESFIEKQRRDQHAIKLELYNYYREEVLQIEERARLEGKIIDYGDEGTLRYAEKEAKKFIIGCEARIREGDHLSPEEDVKFKYLKDLMDRYASLGDDLDKMNRLEREKLNETGYIKLRGLLDDNVLKMKYVDQNVVSERLNIVGADSELKDRLKDFIKYKGFDKLSAREFAQKAANNKISRDILSDMIQFENAVKEGRIDPNKPQVIQPKKEEKAQEKIPEKETAAAKQTEIAEKETTTEKRTEIPEFTEEMKEFLKTNVGKISGLYEAMVSIAEYFGTQDNEKLCQDLSKMSDHLSELADAIEDENDEEIKAAYYKVQESMEKVLLSKYQSGEAGPDKTGFELLLGKNVEGMAFSEMDGDAYESLNEISNKLGFAKYVKVSNDFKKEMEQGAAAATDKLRGKLEQIKALQKDQMSGELKTAFEDLYEKSSSSHTSSIHELKEAVGKLEEELGKTPVREISNALNIFSADIQEVTQGFTFMDEIPICQIAQNGPAERTRISFGDLQKKETEVKASDPVQIQDKDKITAQDILDVKIGGDDEKKSSGADKERIKFDELQEMEGISTKKESNKAHKTAPQKNKPKKVLLNA